MEKCKQSSRGHKTLPTKTYLAAIDAIRQGLLEALPIKPRRVPFLDGGEEHSRTPLDWRIHKAMTRGTRQMSQAGPQAGLCNGGVLDVVWVCGWWCLRCGRGHDDADAPVCGGGGEGGIEK